MNYLRPAVPALIAGTMLSGVAHAIQINDHLEVTGTIEMEASYQNGGDAHASSSDIAVATGELGINGYRE